MRFRLLGNSGLRVSDLALGTMTFGDDWGWGAAKDEARRVYDAFREAVCSKNSGASSVQPRSGSPQLRLQLRRPASPV